MKDSATIMNVKSGWQDSLMLDVVIMAQMLLATYQLECCLGFAAFSDELHMELNIMQSAVNTLTSDNKIDESSLVEVLCNFSSDVLGLGYLSFNNNVTIFMQGMPPALETFFLEPIN